jgi:hypothetical protein
VFDISLKVIMGAGATISGDNLKNNPKSNLNGVATAIMTHSQKGGQPNYGVFEDCSASMIPEETSFDKPKRTHSPLPLSSFKVELLTASRGMTELVLKTIHLRVSHEYLEFFCDLNSPSVLLRVPFEQIKSWKNTETTFEFEVIPNSHVRLNSTVTTSIARNPSLPSKKESKQNEAEVPNNIDASNSNNLEPALAVASSILPDADSNEDDIYAGLVIMKCSEAKKLALESLQAVNRLMIVMQRCGLSKEQISLLSDALIDASSGSLHVSAE